jgi:hypothetical protein
MLNLAEELGITEEKIDSISERYANNEGDKRLIGINFLNWIDGGSWFMINLPIGLSLITIILNCYLCHIIDKIFNLYLPFLIPSADLLYMAYFPAGGFDFYNGILPDFHTNVTGFFCLLGFIGFVFSLPLHFVSFATLINGYTVASLASPVIMGTI